jgi:hypothetical protein
MAKSNGGLKNRGQVLVQEFFRWRESDLPARPTPFEAETAEASLTELSLASGITDEGTLRLLVDLEVSMDLLSALALVPLMEVAWADGHIDDKERAAILQAADAQGIDRDSPAYDLLAKWLDRRPTARLFDAWRDYIVALMEPLLAAERAQLRDALLGRARRVAEAAGGFLGVGAVSREEAQVLERLERELADAEIEAG